MAYGSGTYNLTGVVGFPVSAAVTPNSTVVFNLVGLLDNFTISSASGALVTVNNAVAIANNLSLNTNGGAIAIGTLAGALGTVNATINGGSLIVGGTVLGALNNGTVAFGTNGGTLVLGTANSFVNIATATPITGLSGPTDVIDDRALQYTGSTSYTVANSGANQVVTITQGGHSFQFTTTGTNLATGAFNTLTGGPLQITSDGANGTDLKICFVAGTMLAIPGGERPVESLRPGDKVRTADGRTLKVRWVGRNSVARRFADPLRDMPIRIRAGALAPDVPKRDLLVSPEHAMLVDGVLVQAGALVNGLSISREIHMPDVFVYHHVEVEEHALLLAEGAPAESFVDNVDRRAFDNWAEHAELFGEDDHVEEMDLPRVKSARQVPPRIREVLESRAMALFGARRAA